MDLIGVSPYAIYNSHLIPKCKKPPKGAPGYCWEESSLGAMDEAIKYAAKKVLQLGDTLGWAQEHRRDNDGVREIVMWGQAFGPFAEWGTEHSQMPYYDNYYTYRNLAQNTGVVKGFLWWSYDEDAKDLEFKDPPYQTLAAIQEIGEDFDVKDETQVLYLRFRELVNNKWIDVSVFGHDGTNHGTSEDSGKVGQAVEFGYYNDYVDLHKPDLLRLDNTDFTIAVWVYLHGFPDSWGATIFFEAGGGKGSDWYQCIALSIRTSRKIKLWFYGDQYETSTLVPLGEWTHITVTYDKSSKLGKFYVNGDYKESHTYSHGPAFYEWAGVRLGQRYLEGWGFEVRDFYGKMDELHVYRRVLTPGEVGKLYTEGTRL